MNDEFLDRERDPIRSGEPDRLERRLQFRLSTLLWAVTLLGVSLAVAKIAPLVFVVAGVFVAAVIAHVAGNAMGKQLRTTGTRQAVLQTREQPGSGRPLNTETDFAPVTRLSQNRSLGIPLLLATFMGCVSGAWLSIHLFLIGTWPAATRETMIIGSIAFGVLGGIGAFGLMGFAQVATASLWQAVNERKRS